MIAAARRPYDLFERVELPAPYGQALDLGCGTIGKYARAVEVVREYTRRAELWAKVEGTLNSGPYQTS